MCWNQLHQKNKAVNGSKILILGAAYKPDVTDVRESPALDIIHLLLERNALVSYCDPLINEIIVDDRPYRSVYLTSELLEEMDCVVVVTDHSDFDWAWINQYAGLIVDTRNAFQNIENSDIIKL